jgi:hypothetical protein
MEETAYVHANVDRAIGNAAGLMPLANALVQKLSGDLVSLGNKRLAPVVVVPGAELF